MNLRLTAAAVGLAAATALTGCTADSHDATHQTSSAPTASTAPSGDASRAATATAAEIEFAQAMIPHHEQAVEMADLALAPQAQASPDVRKLAEQIKQAQDPEIQQMTAWLTEWGAALPSATADAHAGHDMAGMGMMSAEQMQQLEDATGEQFDMLWLQMMIDHHEGAVQMAEQVKASDPSPAVEKLADQIIATQNEEIATMQALLAP